KDKAYLEQYQAFMQTHYNVKKKKSEDLITDTALEIAYSLNLTDLEIANVEYTVGLVRILNRKLENTDSHFSNALKLFTNEYGSSHSLVGEIEYWLAMLDLEKREYVRASDRFEKVVAIFSDGRPDASGFLKNSHLYLIKLYYVQEKSAFESDHFTEYLRLEHNWIPRDNIKDNPDEYLPTVRANPYYPARAAENGIEGFVIVKFTVDTNGDTKDVISILSSDEMFERNSIKAASKYKYKPRMVDGEAVEVTDVIVRIEFKLEG
ncbi:MAG: energy transducer TonB, partial [Kordiimonadaceae bacterium]|nr:energy transducer TonB [Kordiimonadaceae bacterium]